MNELSDLRKYNSKTFDQGNGTKKQRAFAGHIHYFNKLGVGDGQQRMREIDFTLEWDSKKKHWTFQYHSFHPVVPEYADQWVKFRDVFGSKDQTTQFRAKCAHVKGRLVKNIPGLTTQNAVIYDDAYGEGQDYIIYFTRSSLKKVVRIRESYKASLTDPSYSFDVRFSSGNKIFRADNRQISYEVDTTKRKEFDTEKSTFIGASDKLEADEYTQFRPFYAWDNNGPDSIKTVVRTDINPTKDGLVLTKYLDSSFISKTVGDVFTDTTSSYYSGAGDGSLNNKSSDNWNTIHDATTGTADYTSAIPWFAYVGQQSGNKDFYRGFLSIDTSGIPDGETITDGTVYMYANTVHDQDNDAEAYLTIVEGQQANDTTLVSGDYDNAGDAVDNPTEGIDSGQRADLSSVSTSAYTTWDLNSTGLGWISKTGYTKLAMREGHDATDTPAVLSTWQRNGVAFYLSEHTDTNVEPYIEVTYGAASPSFTPRAMFF